jgi:hypothetical protein
LLNIKEAIQKAKEYLNTIFDNPDNILLEEIQLAEEAPIWIVTLSSDNPHPLKPIEIAVGKSRIFRTIRIDAKTGEGISLKTMQLF